MEVVLAILTGAMVAGSVFLMLSKNLVRFIFGLVLASNAVNLLIFAAGRLETSRPPLIPETQHAGRGNACQQSASGVDLNGHRHRLCPAGLYFHSLFQNLSNPWHGGYRSHDRRRIQHR
jgi:hypothetical protein